MWNVPMLDLARLHWQRQQELQRCWVELWQRPGPVAMPQAMGGWWSVLRELLALPFDIARHQHAASVRVGALPRSLLESQRFEQQLGLLERLSLGPLSRHVRADS
jgi:hypothetical protein